MEAEQKGFIWTMPEVGDKDFLYCSHDNSLGNGKLEGLLTDRKLHIVCVRV